MADLILSGSTSGTVTVSAPAISGSSVLTLPVATDTLVGKATTDTLTNKTLGASVVQASNAAPAFSAYQSTLQSVSNGTWTKVQLQTEEFDTNSNFDSTTNYRFTPTVAGYYQVSGSVQTQSAVNTAITRCSIYKNGSSFKNGVQVHESTAKVVSSIVSALIYFNGSTDYVELYVYQDTGGASNTQNVQDSTYFQAAMIRSA